MGNNVEEQGSLAKLIDGPHKLAPLLMTGGFLFAIALVIAPRSLMADILLLTALAFALIGGLMELYYLLLISWAYNIMNGSSLRFRDILYALISVGLYYTLLGIALISRRVDGYSRNVNCPDTMDTTVYSIVTLGVHLAVSQTRLALCIKGKLEELATSIGRGQIGEGHILGGIETVE